MEVKDISLMGRDTQGVRLIDVKEGERVVGLARLMEREDEAIEALAGGEAAPETPAQDPPAEQTEQTEQTEQEAEQEDES
jgi:DNA gyrase subunit A